MKNSLLDRLIKYAKIDTQSDENSDTSPSTENQFNLARILVDDLKAIGIETVEVDEYCYVYAKIESNIPEDHPAFNKVPSPGFIAHMDTATNISGKDVQPRIIETYCGTDILLKNNHVITLTENPALRDCIGHTILTADGTTLLGADDKAGIAAIITAAEQLIHTPAQLHPDIWIAFTPDEEVGRGTAHFDLKKFGADFAYTVDGGEAGEINNETFSADHAVITITGRDTHPGTAKDIMVNAIRIAADIVALLPRDMAPETTSKKEPFIHPHDLFASVENATIKLLLRAFETNVLDEQKKVLQDIIDNVGKAYPNATISLDITRTYRNMKNTLETVPHVTRYLEEAVKRTGVEARWQAIRGGTDGSGLTAMGLPCPNIFTGGNNFHSFTEWISIDILEKASQTVLNIIDICVEKALPA